MGYPRSKYVIEGEEGVYHCFTRCVRRAFLQGLDPVSGIDYSHRKVWIVDRLRYLAGIFAIEVCAYDVMINHYHSILRTRPDLAAGWSDMEVATRWVTLCPKHRKVKGVMVPVEDQIRALTQCPARIAELRKRLCSLSWFMGQLNGYIARVANKEDKVKGRFFEARFEARALLDLAGIAASMTYVDLNLVRAGVAATPEDSDFTSIQERIRAWQSANHPSASESIPTDASWLCPIASNSTRRGILPQMTLEEYFTLVDQSGRLLHPDKRGAIPADLAPILVRIGAKPEAWVDTISRFRTKFRLAAGRLANMRTFAHKIGSRWLVGVAAARSSFAS